VRLPESFGPLRERDFRLLSSARRSPGSAPGWSAWRSRSPCWLGAGTAVVLAAAVFLVPSIRELESSRAQPLP
jgi:hypothetical protein